MSESLLVVSGFVLPDPIRLYIQTEIPADMSAVMTAITISSGDEKISGTMRDTMPMMMSVVPGTPMKNPGLKVSIARKRTPISIRYQPTEIIPSIIYGN